MSQFYPDASSSTLHPVPFQSAKKPALNFEIHTLHSFHQNTASNKNGFCKLVNFEFFWIKDGEGLLMIDLQQFAIGKKKLFAISPGQVRYLEAADTIDGYYLSLSPDFFYAVESDLSTIFFQYEAVKKAVILEVDETNQEEVEDTLIKMKKECAQYSATGTEILKGLFRLFLLYISRNFTNTETSVDNRRDKCLVQNFTELLCRHFKTKKMVLDYANELCVTPSYLNQVVKKVSGFTASYHIQQCLVQEAKRQAILSGSSMKEIAYNLGFDDTAHFSKFFKNNSGINFSHFRKNFLSNGDIIAA